MFCNHLYNYIYISLSLDLINYCNRGGSHDSDCQVLVRVSLPFYYICFFPQKSVTYWFNKCNNILSTPKSKSLKITTYKSVYSNKAKIGSKLNGCWKSQIYFSTKLYPFSVSMKQKEFCASKPRKNFCTPPPNPKPFLRPWDAVIIVGKIFKIICIFSPQTERVYHRFIHGFGMTWPRV